MQFPDQYMHILNLSPKPLSFINLVLNISDNSLGFYVILSLHTVCFSHSTVFLH
jgi:hypothetical protein